MNHIVDFEARTLATLLASGDILGMRMFLERMQMPLDVQDRLLHQASSLSSFDVEGIAALLEEDGQSLISERLSY
ncbi:MAG: hypothetical protein SAqMacA_28820 [Shewanella algae]